MAKSKNSSQHNQNKKDHKNGYAYLESPDDRAQFLSTGPHTDTVASQQHQKAQDPPLPIPQRHGPEIPKKSQTCAARNDEGTGAYSMPLIRSFQEKDKKLTPSVITERGEGRQARRGMRALDDCTGINLH
ncbi:hypothetical protein H2201_007220 [Coniosporium apollinis]|uniref:Uncharacterized protein n=2 Tax=Coniosporium TaxID=2810619 RepID=A0ABQ9NKE1_9PEZI|nr:hypothetical protein H2199_002038 [Cladosporium sp. JES 115]KAJ9659784.1 hypothetical protein H2201_007220 [Coniosporium apollinis]